jgi:nicotinate-nucleotide adenylyltransferase
MPAGRRRLGVLGGSFNPPHIGHLVMASVACGQLGLERVVFVPAAVPPHKVVADDIPAAVRFALTEAATAEDMRFTVSTVEIDLDLAYTRDVLTALDERYAGSEFVFLMGTDSLLQFGSWREPEAILALAGLAVARRPGDDPQAIAAAIERWGEDRVTLLDMPPLAVSSTDVRRRVRGHLPIRYLVPRAVEDLIISHGLYGAA